jgi:protein-S-isoprenylcysteine O-methyltransferase
MAFNYGRTFIEPTELSISLILGVSLWVSCFFDKVDQFGGILQVSAILLGCSILGASFGFSLMLPSFFGLYISLFCYFHLSEFVYISFSHGNCRFDSLLLNHGALYASAFSAALIEYELSPLRLPHFVKQVGLVVAVIGLVIRAVALLTAGEAFTHIISSIKKPNHMLVETGIFGLMRHPGYSGWLLWVTGSQILVGNPISASVFFIVTWLFFKDRIEYEEELLVNMFGEAYVKYRRKVPLSGVLFIR